MTFSIDKTDGAARAGTLITAHSTIKTPVFMPVGTVGAVKSLDAVDMMQILDAQIILGNTYHLYLRPGSKVVKELGGLHGFTKFNRSFLTDSGGFQAFSLSKISKPDENGIKFKSHIDGSAHYFTPRSVLDTQYDLNSDIMMILDDLVALPAEKKRVELSIKRTIKWAREAIDYHKFKQNNGEGLTQNIFGIIQGGTDEAARKFCAEALCEMPFDGLAIGGLSVGESNQEMYDTVQAVMPYIDAARPRYLMGVGTPEDLVENVARGVDMFDCVMPTRNARNGMLFTAHGTINIKNKKWENDFSPIDENGYTFVDTYYTKAYLRHLFAAEEFLGKQIATIHNLGFYLWLVREARKHILQGDFSQWKAQMVSQMNHRL